MAKKLWLNKVAESNSDSEETERNYNYASNQYCDVIGMTLDEIAEEWDNIEDYMSEKKFRRRHERLVAQYKLWLKEQKYAKSSRSVRIAIIQSFYNSLPDLRIDFGIPKAETQYHNRDITDEEITKVLNQASPRDRTIFCMMAQGGLSPKNSVLLKYKHIKEDFEANKIPCCIQLPKEISKSSHSNHFTFIGEESVEYLKQYFEVRGVPNDDDLVFLPTRKDRRGKGIVERKSLAMRFTEIVQQLGLISEKELEERKGKPKTVRLYNLRKFFRKYAGLAGADYVNFWMGHKLNYKAEHIPSSDEYYFSRTDIDFHREIFREKSMPNLGVGSIATSETESVKMKILERELEETKKKLNSFETIFNDRAIVINKSAIEKLMNEGKSKEQLLDLILSETNHP